MQGIKAMVSLEYKESYFYDWLELLLNFLINLLTLLERERINK